MTQLIQGDTFVSDEADCKSRITCRWNRHWYGAHGNTFNQQTFRHAHPDVTCLRSVETAAAPERLQMRL